jgi:hypothetical protein
MTGRFTPSKLYMITLSPAQKGSGAKRWPRSSRHWLSQAGRRKCHTGRGWTREAPGAAAPEADQGGACGCVTMIRHSSYDAVVASRSKGEDATQVQQALLDTLFVQAYSRRYDWLRKLLVDSDGSCSRPAEEVLAHSYSQLG